jgi:hypothetical protein
LRVHELIRVLSDYPLGAEVTVLDADSMPVPVHGIAKAEDCNEILICDSETYDAFAEDQNIDC